MVLGTAGLNTHIWNNNLRSFMLLALYPLIIMAMFWGFIFASTLIMSYGYDRLPVAMGASQASAHTKNAWIFIIGVVAIWFTISYFFHTRIIRQMSGSHPVSRTEEPTLYNMLENLCISRGITMPKLEIIESAELNAFASGINNSSYTITVTRGLVEVLDDEEMEAVLGHELTHIINHDVRLLIISIIFVGMIGTLAQGAWRGLLRGSRFGRRNNRNSILFMLLLAVILSIGYFASLLTRFSLSRKREYMADAGAVLLTKNPDAMMRALLKISGHDQIGDMPADIKLMCIENRQAFLGMFATHPPIDKRIQALSENTATPIPTLRRPSAHQEADTQSGRKNPWRR